MSLVFAPNQGSHCGDLSKRDTGQAHVSVSHCGCRTEVGRQARGQSQETAAHTQSDAHTCQLCTRDNTPASQPLENTEQTASFTLTSP